MREIDIESWPRREHYRFFMGLDYPQYNLCFDVDVSKLVPFCRERGLSFYYALLYCSTLAANAVEAFRYRARGDKVVLHDGLHPSFTDMSKDSDLFRIVTVEMPETLEAFVERAAARSSEQVHPFDFTGFEGRDDLIYYTSIPWVSFTQLNHTITHDREDSVPRLSWGKYREEGGPGCCRFVLPYSVQVHHAFVDGLHIARFKDTLESALNAL